MSARLARSVFPSFRVAARPRATFGLTARRNMSTESHGPQTIKSDKPWIIGAAVIFGPLFLYLISPSARKSQHAVHDDHHDSTTSKNAPSHSEPQREEKLPEVMKDDEGTPADVTATIALSEESDVPKDSQSPEAVAETTIAAEQAPVGEEAVKENVAAAEAAGADEPAKETPTAPADSQASASPSAKTEA